MEDAVPTRARKGRGAVSNRSGRFEAEIRHAVDDGWEQDPLPGRLVTTLTPESARRVITCNQSPDVPFDRSLNPYRGCEHGCIYCFARPTHAYLGHSPGLDFETRLYFKPDAPQLLEAELRRRSYRCAVLAMGTNTDPYQPVEREKGITRAVLEVLRAFRHPVAIVTKSNLVTRDIDILADMARDGLAQVCLSVTTLDRDLARRMEPRAATPERRLDAIAALSRAGVPTGILAAPMIPGLNDAELEAILARGRKAGADMASYLLLRLPLEIKDLFKEWLESHVPDRAGRVLSLIRDTRGGALYDSAYGRRGRGTGEYAALLKRRHEVACRRLGLNAREYDLDCSLFRPPPERSDQFDLFPR